MDAPSDAFLWVKALHIIAVVCWFAALFYLPRLYVYHAMSDDAVSHQRFEVMERKLYRGIMWPAMIATLISAHFLVDWGDATRHYHEALWFYLKVGLVGLLVIFACIAWAIAAVLGPLAIIKLCAQCLLG